MVQSLDSEVILSQRMRQKIIEHKIRNTSLAVIVLTCPILIPVSASLDTRELVVISYFSGVMNLHRSSLFSQDLLLHPLVTRELSILSNKLVANIIP